MFEPHNEHRIAFTRLVSMGLLALNNGVWSNLVEAYANALIYALVLALLCACLTRDLQSRTTRLMMLLAIIGIGCHPFDWENNLVGFQNQFYLMAACAVLLTGMAAYRAVTWTTFALIFGLSVASLFTMASGLLAPLAVVVVLSLRAWHSQLRAGPARAIVLVAVVATAAGLLLTPTIAGHASLKAQGLLEHIQAFLTFLVWPRQPLNLHNGLFLLVIWWPLLAWAIRFLRTRQSSQGELFAVGMLAWVLLQAAAFAHARGHDAVEITSRYADLPAFALLANLVLGLFAWERSSSLAWRRIAAFGVTFSTLLIGAVFAHRLPMDLAAMHQRHEFLLIEAHYTRAYLRDRKPEDLQHSGLMVPYISGDALREMLDKPTIVGLLPSLLLDDPGANDAVSSRPSRHGGWLSRGALALQDAIQHALGHSDNLGTFSATPSIDATEATRGRCYIDAVNSVAGQSLVMARPEDSLQLNGWAVDASLADSRNLDVLLEGPASFSAVAHTHGIRQDVVRALHSRADITKQFTLLAVIPDMPPGTYDVLLASHSPQPYVICHSGLRVTVQN